MLFRPLLLLASSAAQIAIGQPRRLVAAGVILAALSLTAPQASASEEAVGASAGASSVDAAGECSEPGTCSSGEEGGVARGAAAEAEEAAVADEQRSEGGGAQSQSQSQSPPPATSPTGDRLITHDELGRHVRKEDRIWLSILGKVYDVTEGIDFYGQEKGSYKFYAGRDASPCFSTGKNNEDGAGEDLLEWEDKKLMSVYEWSEFYANHETYEYLGVLAGSRFYGEGGEELQARRDIVARASEAKRVADEEKEKRKKERQAAREARKQKKKCVNC